MASTARSNTKDSSRRRPSEAERSESRAAERRSRLTVHERTPRPRVRFTTMFTISMVAAIAFGALATHISLIHRQIELDSVRSEITAIQEKNKELRRRESRLQAPDEIRRIATDSYGMVANRGSELVTPDPQLIGVLNADAATSTTIFHG